MLELGNLEEASKPSVERKFDEFGTQSTGIPVIILKFFYILFLNNQFMNFIRPILKFNRK